jgi:co-chaperonin GroES (HSP10)
MKIEPLDGIVYLKFEEAQAGGLDTSSRASAVEYAEVVAVPEHTHETPCKYWKIHKGDHVFVKSWAVDSIYHEGKEYRFCNIKTDGILAIVRQ